MKLLRFKAPQMTRYVYSAPPFLQVIEIFGELPYIYALLVNLESQIKNLNLRAIVTLRPISSKSSRLQASRSVSYPSHCPPGKTMLSVLSKSTCVPVFLISSPLGKEQFDFLKLPLQ